MALFSFPAQVNERAARLVAGFVAVTAIAALATRAHLLVPLLAAGFVLRVAWGPKVDPVGRLAAALAPRWWAVVPVTGRPKRFAQAIGAVVTLSATGLFLAGQATAAWALVGVLALFATLEAAFAFCFGCQVYAWLQAAGVFPADACVDCGPGRKGSGQA